MGVRGRTHAESYTVRSGTSVLRPMPASDGNPSVTAMAATVVVIHSHQIISECIVAGFRAADPRTEFKCHLSVEAWTLDESRTGNDILLRIIEKDEDVLDIAVKSLEQIRNVSSPSKLLFLSDRREPQVIIKALELGLDGYVLSDTSFDEVLQVFQLIRVGGRFFPASILKGASTDAFVPVRTPVPEQTGTFSPRQLSVAKALRRGTPNKIIAYELSMCESTVKVHVRQIMKKLKAKNRTEVAYLTNQMFAAE